MANTKLVSLTELTSIDGDADLGLIVDVSDTTDSPEGTSKKFKPKNLPVSTATQTALDAKEATVSSGTTSQYYRGDKSWQILNKSAVGLGNVDNTSDADKPISTATQTALDLKQNASTALALGETSSTAYRGDRGKTAYDHSQASGNPHGTTKSDLGLGSVDNTADADKPVSTATQTALNLKATINPRVTSVASSATPSFNIDSYDCLSITALATAITSMTSGLSGTASDFRPLIIRIKDNGTTRNITWGASFENKGATLPTATKAGKVHTIGLLYDSVTSKWGCVSAIVEA